MRRLLRPQLATHPLGVRAPSSRALAVGWSRRPKVDEEEDLGEYYEYEDYDEGPALDAGTHSRLLELPRALDDALLAHCVPELRARRKHSDAPPTVRCSIPKL